MIPLLNNKLYLRQLADLSSLEFDGLRIRLVHGSPRKINEYVHGNRPDATMERLLDLAEADILVRGHTHIPYHRLLPSGRHVANAGVSASQKMEMHRLVMWR